MSAEGSTSTHFGPISFAVRLFFGLLSIVVVGLALYFYLRASHFETGKAKRWDPIAVDIWEPPFVPEGQRRSGSYEALDRVSHPWRLCVSIPHLKDPYWRGVNYGLVREAARLGVGMRIVEAGGYDHLPIQRAQIEDCMARGADGLIVASVHYEGVNDLVDRFRGQGKPVIDLINGMSSTNLTARAAVDFEEMGFVAGSYLRSRHLDSTVPVRVAWFAGPEGASWAIAGDRGFRSGVASSAIEIVGTARGDTGRTAQKRLIEDALNRHTDLDYIVGTTVTANVAVGLLRQRGLLGKIKVMAYYYGPVVHDAIRRGDIVAAPTDLQAIQARIAVDLAVRALEKEEHPGHVSPRVLLVDQNTIDAIDPSYSLAPRGFRPVFSVNDWGI